jgi:DNA-binding NarL/FixJ family response regulator
VIRVVLVDDQELVRTGLAMVVDSQDDMRVVGQASDGAQALDVVATTPADVVLMDVRMPRMDGVEATRRLLARHPDGPRVVVLTTFDLDEHAFAALKAGASGFLLKDAAAEDVLAAVRAVHAGDAVLAPSTTRRLVAHVVGDLPGPTTGPDPMAALTEREREVLLEVASGASNAEIAQRMYLSEATVKTHVGRLLAKLQLRDRVQAVVLAYETGLVRPRSTDRPRGVPGRS